MLKNMQDVNMRVCQELQQSLRNEEMRSNELIGNLGQAVNSAVNVSQPQP
jgi:hypothetical protein